MHARSSSQPAGKPSRLTTEALSKLALGLASSGIAIGLAYLTWTDFADSRRDAMARVSAAASIIEEHTRRSLLATDIVLESVTEWVEQRGVAALRSPMEWEHLRKLAGRLPASGALFIMDQAGEVIAATPSDPPPRANVSDREWFRHLKEGHQALYIGRALTGRTVHSIFFPIARPVRGPDGKFSGAVQVGVEVNEIAEVFRQIDLGQDGQLGLYRVSDGAVVARQPMTGTQINESIAALPFFPAATNTQESSWIGTVRMGDRDHFLSARRVQDLPLIVVASTSKAHADAGVWSRLLWHSIVAAAIVTALAGLTFGAVRRVRRESTRSPPRSPSVEPPARAHESCSNCGRTVGFDCSRIESSS